MSRTSLIIADTLFVIVLAVSYQRGDLQEYPVILIPLLIAAFATCVIRHVNYYHITKKIF